MMKIGDLVVLPEKKKYLESNGSILACKTGKQIRQVTKRLWKENDTIETHNKTIDQISKIEIPIAKILEFVEVDVKKLAETIEVFLCENTDTESEERISLLAATNLAGAIASNKKDILKVKL